MSEDERTLSDDELAARFVQRGVHPDLAAHLVRYRDDIEDDDMPEDED